MLHVPEVKTHAFKTSFLSLYQGPHSIYYMEYLTGGFPLLHDNVKYNNNNFLEEDQL